MLNWFLSNRDLWERPLLDLWTIPHLLSGVLIALAVRYKNGNILNGFFINLIVAVLWETFEITKCIARVEYFSNQIADIIFAQIGFFIAIYIFKENTRKTLIKWNIITLGFLFIATLLVGWAAYRSYIS